MIRRVEVWAERSRAAALGTCLAVCLVTAVAAAGCGSRPAPTATERPEARPAFAAQVAAVRTGRASGIVVTQPPAFEDWESLRGLAGLREVVVEDGADDRAAAILATLPDLERLVLRRSPLSDAGFAALAGCPRLRDLNVPQAGCTAAGVRSLASLGSLRSLRLGGPRLAGAEVGDAVAELARLRSLHLIDVPLGDGGLAALQRLEGLWNLYLDGAGVSDEAWGEYFRVRPGVHVHVDQAHHDRDPGRHDDGNGGAAGG
jgi:hypothetical protein